CPKCEKLHAKHAGKREMVNGLMKACYLAFSEGRYDKASDLARQAHAVDPARVEADPLVYKMHLLGQGCRQPQAECEEQQAIGADGSLTPPLPDVDPSVPEAMDGVLTGGDGLGKAKTHNPPKK